MATKVNNQDLALSAVSSNDFITDLAYVKEYDTFYLWKDTYYKQLDNFYLRKTFYLYLCKTFPNIPLTDSRITDVFKASRYFINNISDMPDFGQLAFNDMNFNMNTFEIEPHDKKKMTVLGLPHDTKDLSMPTPIWNDFLDTSLVHKQTKITDEPLVEFVQEMFGYFLLPGLKGSSAFFLVGDGSNGKSVMVKVLELIFGKEFCSSSSIQDLTMDKFRKASLVGKVINISNEEESKFIKADVLKALITGDTMTAEKKFGDPFTFTPTTKFIFCTNEMPKFDTFNYGLERRLKFIPFFRRFEDNEQDKNLIEKLKAEIPGIIGWAIEGAKKFVEGEHVFHPAQSSIDMLASFIEEISSGLTFFNQNYIIDDDSRTADVDVYNKYKKWCENNGRGQLNSNNFWREINKKHGNKLKEVWCMPETIESTRSVRGKNIIEIYDTEKLEPEITVQQIEF